MHFFVLGSQYCVRMSQRSLSQISVNTSSRCWASEEPSEPESGAYALRTSDVHINAATDRHSHQYWNIFFSLYRLVERVEVDDMMHFNMVTTEMPIKSQVPMLSIFRCCVFVQRDSTRQTFLTVNIAIVSLVSFLVQFRRQEHLSLSNLFDYTVFGKKWGSAERSSLTPPVKELSIVVPEYICTIGIAISLHFTVGDKRLQCHSIIRWNCGCNADKTNIHKCTPRILDTFCVLLGFVVDECLHPSMVLNVSKSTLINMGPWIHCELIIQPQQSRAQQNRAHKSCGICYTSFF